MDGLKKRYEWRRLTSDGLLLPPHDCGRHYDRDTTLSNGAWETEEEAVSAYSEVTRKYEYGHDYELVLICLWSKELEF